MLRVAINGFGRIGRNFLRVALERETPIEVVAINDLAAPETNAHLLRFDSTHGRLGCDVELANGTMTVGAHRMMVLAQTDPTALPWEELGVDVVVESTGRFTDGAKARSHLEAGAQRVVISAPATNVDGTFVIGVNDGEFDPERHFILSNASCTTNCFVPMMRVLEDAFGVQGGLMSTIHAYTNDQNLLDLTHNDLRRARAAAVNIVPAATGAARATALVMPEMKGRLDGSALRVPVQDGSITDVSIVVKATVTAQDVNAAFRRAAESGPLSGVLVYSEDPLVSSDIVGSPASCTFDAPLTMTMDLGNGSTLVKAFGWYDNEWGYSNRLVDLVELVGSPR
ncbi:MAG: type I glyceraldehyde-3-phosphate dehydrogenase [Acidimicrobiales bacterium]